jgi:hypothetical protein
MQAREREMIPERLVDFVHGPRVMFVGTRNAKLRPTATWAFGALADGPEGTVTMFVPETEGAQTFENIADNGRLSFVAVDPPTHDTYQFKGSHKETRPCTDADYTVQEIYLNKLIAALEPFGYGAPLWGGFKHKPARAVTFTVEDIFVQTPGPGAGEKIELS